MLKFNFSKISQVPTGFYRKRKEISGYLSEIQKIIAEGNLNFPESFLVLPERKPVSKAILPKGVRLTIVIGVGGSSNGTQAVFQALCRKERLTETLFLDALNPFFLRRVIEGVSKFKKGEVLIYLISKSGKTFEILANFFTLFQNIKKYRPKIFVITDKNSPLWQFAEKRKLSFFAIPQAIVGRYSVFSRVGLFPLSSAGIDIKQLLLGAKRANEICLQDNPLKNPALASALTIFYHWQKRKNIYSNLVFPPDLEYFGRWYVQLMAEGLGKAGKGITPIVTTGTTDFHAIGQLFFDGPKDKLINFVFVEDLDLDYQIPEDEDLDSFFPGASKKKIWQVNKAIFEGVKKAYLKKKLPFTETILEKLDEKNLGFLLQMKMIEIILLAKLMKVNAFDQPGVELYKEETRRILQR